MVIRSANKEHISQAVESYVSDLCAHHPEIERVFWFGSWVTGIPTPGSDVDLCIVVTSSHLPVRDRMVNYLPIRFPVGIDLFVYTREEFDRLDEVSPGWKKVILAGVELG
ncbi:MAG: nucleotidyltransferase domain-containing protein [Chloroflexota bacterium]